MNRKEKAFDGLPKASKVSFLKLLNDEIRSRNDIVYFAQCMLGIELNPFQKRYLIASTTPRAEYLKSIGKGGDDISGMLYGKTITPCANQVGKTVSIAIKHIWFNKYKIGMDLQGDMMDTAFYSTLNISPHTRQTKACFRYVKEILYGEFIIEEEGKKHLNELAPLMKNFIVGENSNLGEIRFANKSVMYSVPVGQDQASSLAGAQFALITYDEASQSYHLKDELGAKVLSRLIKYGVALDLIATPEVDAPSHQHYMHLAKLGRLCKDGWISITGILDDNIFIPEAQRNMIKADLMATDKKRYLQVVKGEFISGGKRFFDSNEIENLWTLSSKRHCEPGHKYLLVADWGMSDSGDPSVFKVFDRTNYPFGPTGLKGTIDLVNHETIKGGSPQMQFALLRALYEQYTHQHDDGVGMTPPEFLMDAQSLGGVVIKKLLALLKPKAFSIEKETALMLLKNAMSDGRNFYVSEVDGATIEMNPLYGLVRSYYIDELNDQLGIYQVEDEKLTTDFVMTFMMGISYIVKNYGGKTGKPASFNQLGGFNARVETRKGRQIPQRILR